MLMGASSSLLLHPSEVIESRNEAEAMVVLDVRWSKASRDDGTTSEGWRTEDFVQMIFPVAREGRDTMADVRHAS